MPAAVGSPAVLNAIFVGGPQIVVSLLGACLSRSSSKIAILLGVAKIFVLLKPKVLFLNPLAT